jgi:hypothetical protein
LKSITIKRDVFETLKKRFEADFSVRCFLRVFGAAAGAKKVGRAG